MGHGFENRQAAGGAAWLGQGPVNEALDLLQHAVALAFVLLAVSTTFSWLRHHQPALGQLIQFGSDRALETQYQALALQKCQSKMAELMCGSEPLGSQTDSSFANDDTGEWRWSVEANEDQIAKLWHVKVTVSRRLADGKVEVTLSQYVLDPSTRVGPAQAAGATGGTTAGN